MEVSLLVLIGLLAPAGVIAVGLLLAWLSSAEADRQLYDEETAQAESLQPKPPGLAS